MVNVLVVDDDPAIRSLLTDVLEMEGYEVTTAPYALTAVRIFEADRPDFVVLDVMMPGLDGFDVLRSIRAQPGDAVPVLMLTAAAGSDANTRAWASGVDFYLAKPFSPDAVLDLIDHVLSDQVAATDDQ